MSAKTQNLVDSMKKEFKSRKFVAGVLVAMVDLFLSLDVPSLKAGGFDAVLSKYPRRDKLATGGKANTLVLDIGSGKSVSLRPFYNSAEKLFRADNKRFGFPSCAPHATQSWGDYVDWLDTLSTLSTAELKELRAGTIDFVLEELPSHEFDPQSISVQPPLFKEVLEDFSLVAQKGEPTGAAFQGLVFGFLRADNPHLQMEVAKVRTGSKRLQRVGDIDAWDGSRLAVTAEVKQFDLEDKNVSDLAAFANEATKRGAIGIVVALGFAEGVREAIEATGVRALDRDDLLKIVSLWDPTKQQIAVSSMLYCFTHVEKDKNLAGRLESFLTEAIERGSTIGKGGG